MGEIADESTYNERQKQLMLQQHQLEMQRIEREFQLRAQAEERARQRSIETRKQEEIQIERAMESAHPGWRTTANSKAFLDWKDRQPASVRGLYESDRLADAMLMLDLFKRDTLVRSSR